MSGNIRDVVFKKAEEEAINIIENARKEAEKIIEGSVKRKKEIVEEERNKIMKDIGIDRRIAEARMKSRQIISLAKNRIIKKAEEEVKKLLESMDEKKRLKSLQILVTEAIDEILSNFEVGIGKVIICISKKDRELSRELMEYIRTRFKDIDVEIKEVDILGGVIVESPDGGIIIDNSYDSRLKKALDSLLNEFQRIFEL